MPIFAGNGSIEGGTSAITIKNSSSANIFSRGIQNSSGVPFGYFNNTNIPAFVAGSATDPGWTSPVSNGTWGKINQVCTTTAYNRGNHYNTSTTRFTAPVTGPYWFSFTAYLYSASYVHPAFTINGSLTSGWGHLQHRIRGHGMAANYQQDAQIEEIMYLTAGSYVEVYWYAGGASFHYSFYSLFQGMYVG